MYFPKEESGGIMSNRKGGGKKGKDKHKNNADKNGFSLTNDVIEFTPQGAFNIRSVAQRFSNLMRESCQDLIIHLPHVSVEFEAGCTPEEIVAGYHLAMRRHAVTHVSNANMELV